MEIVIGIAILIVLIIAAVALVQYFKAESGISIPRPVKIVILAFIVILALLALLWIARHAAPGMFGFQ